MRHLFNCRAEVLRQTGTVVDGMLTSSYPKVTDVVDPYLGTPGELMCRLDLALVRAGKDLPAPVVAGRAPDRVGVMFYSTTDAIKAGDRIHVLDGPATGTFEIRAIPDPVQDQLTAHHMEVQVIEVAQALANVFPAGIEP